MSRQICIVSSNGTFVNNELTSNEHMISLLWLYVLAQSVKLKDHVTATGHNIKWDHFEILAKGRSDTHRKIKETLLIQELKPTLNDDVSSEKLYLY